jgi:hypothetical protein
VSSLLDAILDGATDGLEDGPVITISSKLEGLSRSAALFTEAELHNLVRYKMVKCYVSTEAPYDIDVRRSEGKAPPILNLLHRVEVSSCLHTLVTLL